MRGLLVVSHCILNPFTVVRGLTPHREAARAVAAWALRNDAALLQMPCPESVAAGLERPQRDRAGYETADFREVAARLATDLTAQLAAHVARGHPILGLVGVDGSPSCGVDVTTRGVGPRETKVAEPGVFVETLREVFARAGLAMPFLGLPRRSGWQGPAELERRLDTLLPAAEPARKEP